MSLVKISKTRKLSEKEKRIKNAKALLLSFADGAVSRTNRKYGAKIALGLLQGEAEGHPVAGLFGPAAAAGAEDRDIGHRTQGPVVLGGALGDAAMRLATGSSVKDSIIGGGIKGLRNVIVHDLGYLYGKQHK